MPLTQPDVLSHLSAVADTVRQWARDRAADDALLDRAPNPDAPSERIHLFCTALDSTVRDYLHTVWAQAYSAAADTVPCEQCHRTLSPTETRQSEGEQPLCGECWLLSHP